MPGKHEGSPKAIGIVLCFFKLSTTIHIRLRLYKPHSHAGWAEPLFLHAVGWMVVVPNYTASLAFVVDPFVAVKIMKHPLTQFIPIIKHRNSSKRRTKSSRGETEVKLMTIVRVFDEIVMVWHLATIHQCRIHSNFG